MVPRIVPIEQFYVVSKNAKDPVVAVDGWSLEISGLVDRPVTVSYAELLSLPVRVVERTLSCISNPIGGREIGNTVWAGVPLDDLLALAGARPEAAELVFTSVDRYVEHLPLAKIREGTTLLVHTMNGQPLPPRHGFPARVLTTGRYGMKNPKWVRRIDVAAGPEPGYWERLNWSPTAPVRTTARIDVPSPGQRLTLAEFVAGGIAFAGDRRIQRVEVSLDLGNTWTPADLEPSPSPLTWVRWAASLVLPGPGQFQVMARAIDGGGQVQDPTVMRSFPSGSSGYHRVLVELPPS